VKLACASATPLVFVLSIHAQTLTARIPLEEISGVPIVQVSVNGTGPYPFVLDTGANVTMIKQQLLHQLHMAAAGYVTIAGSLGDSPQQRAEAATFSIAGQVVEHLEINTLEAGQLGALESRVQGILGENFLKYFDLLIDNDQHALTLEPIADRTPNLENSLDGEHLHLSRTGSFHSTPTWNRIVVPLQTGAPMARAVFFLLDSGSNTAMLYPAKEEAAHISWSSSRGNVHSLNANQSCQVQHTTLAMGRQTFRGVVLAACGDRTRDKTDTDGLLPTGIFHRLFISHRQEYVIANPHAAAQIGSP
jgi:Aspartyl protease